MSGGMRQRRKTRQLSRFITGKAKPLKPGKVAPVKPVSVARKARKR